MSRPFRNVFLSILCLPFFAAAQQSSAPPAAAGQPGPLPQVPALSSRPAPAPVPGSGEGRLTLDVVVADKSGKPVSGLDRDDFALLDNNLPNPILSFRAAGGGLQKAEPPVEVILLIDTVNLPFSQVSFIRQEVARFLRQDGGHLAQPVSLFALTDQGLDVQQKPTVDGNGLAAQVVNLDDQLRTVGRSGGAYGAMERVELSVRALQAIAQAEAKKPGKKLLIWAGPGWPMLDSARIEISAKGQQQYFDAIVQLSAQLREARISVYSISAGLPGPGTFLYGDFLKGVKSAEKANPPNLSLKVLAVQSGGRVLGPDNDLAAQIGSCIADAGAFYTLSFDPPRADRADEYHDLKVQIHKPGLTAHTNTGYYNQP